MTEYIIDQGLLPEDEVQMIVEKTPLELVRWQEAVGGIELSKRPDMQQWLDFFDMTAGNLMRTTSTPSLVEAFYAQAA